MNRLALRLTVVIVVTTLLAVGLVAVIANQAAGSEFRRYLSGSETAAEAELAPALVGYYARAGSWQGIEQTLDVDSPAQGQGRGRGRGLGNVQGRGAALLLASADGRIVYDSQGQQVNEQLSPSDLALALPLLAEDGQRVGYLLVRHGASSQLAAPEQDFLDRINQALLLAAGLALLLGVILGAVLARTLAAPLGQVSAAAQAIAAGDLSQRVPERGTVETQTLAHSFNQMAENLEQAERLRRNLLADVAHELRTPLTVIQGNLQALLDGVYPLERAEIATIYDETRLLSRLVADLRELAQAEAGQLQLHRGPVDVAAVLAQTVESFACWPSTARSACSLTRPQTCRWFRPTLTDWPRCCVTCSPTQCATLRPAATCRSSPGSTWGGCASAWSTTALASPRPTCRTSSIASGAAIRPAAATAAAPAWASPSPSTW
jgi:two-component system, OmpR family, sensor kinase